MRKLIKVLSIILLSIILVVVAGIYLINSSRISTEEFGIFFLENNELVISDNEIIWYNKTSCQIKLTQEAAEKISSLEIPVGGKQFVIKIDGEEIYTGSFWVSFSSISYSGIVIDTLRIQNNTISLDLGYPSSRFFKGADNRNNPIIINHFQNLSKLRQ